MQCKTWTKEDLYTEGNVKESVAYLTHLAEIAVEQHQALGEAIKNFERIANGTKSTVISWMRSLNIEIPQVCELYAKNDVMLAYFLVEI